MTTTAPKESANIVGLRIKNFLSIADVEIKPGKVTQIVGKNNQGKTTILKALEFASKGSTDGSLVKNGEDAAEVIVELSDQTTIRRRINSEGKQTVDVKRDGFKAPSPQTYLEALFDFSAFNPIELLDPKKRSEAILKSIDIKVDQDSLAAMIEATRTPGQSKLDLPPLDFDQHGLKVIEQCHKYFFQRRAEANKDAAAKKQRWETYKADFKAIPEPDFDQVTIDRHRKAAHDDLVQQEKELTRIRVGHAQAKKAQETLDRYCKALDEIDSKIAETEAYLRTLQARREEGQKFVDEARAAVPEALEGDGHVLQNIEDRKRQLSEIDLMEKDLRTFEQNKKQLDMIAGMEGEYAKAQEFANSLDQVVGALAGKIKTDIMANAEMPIKGLEYVDGEFKVDGVSVDNLSSSKALKLAVGVARKLAKKTKVICIDGAELLDEATWTEMRKEIAEDGFTYFLTKVGEPFAGEDSVISMKAGQVVQ